MMAGLGLGSRSVDRCWVRRRLWRSLAVSGGLWRPLILAWDFTPWRPLALCRVLVVLLWVVPRLLWRCRGSCRVFGVL